ncbi:hypothetical protein Tco_1016425 [Tanacetum coccineum]|uniref:Uncharacterized protein n=1 Tax=Tanacetum coccineum TaxID=301880 RepID=A0ABQ5FNT1_9ASTR
MIVEKHLMLEMLVDESLEMIVDESLEMIVDESLDMIEDESFDMIVDESLMVEDKSLKKLMDETLKLDEEHFKSMIADKFCKLNSFLESSDLVPRSSDTKFVYTKDDGDVMFIEIIRKYDDSHEEGPKDEENMAIQGLEVKYFDTD